MQNRTAISSPVIVALLLTGLLSHSGQSLAAGDLATLCQPFTSDQDTPLATDADVPYSASVFWRIDGGNGAPSYILGTMHSQDRLVTNLSPQQRLRLAQSERLLIEVKPDAQANADYMAAIFNQRGAPLDESLPAPLYTRLETIAQDYGLPPERLPQLAPWAAFSQIGRPKPVNGPTMDMVIYETALRMEKQIVGLETMSELVDTLASLPREDQIIILKDTICNHARIVRESKTLLDLYVAGDLAAMVAFNNQPHYDEAVFDRFMQAVLYDRNQRIFERLQPYLQRGGNFIALGALHLPENQGLLALIDNAGYNITPLQ